MEVAVMSMRKLADHIVAVAQKNSLPVTNLQLQKIMYFLLKIAKKNELLSFDELKRIYDEKFQVWQYGPVIPEEYIRFKKFASESIIGDYEETEQFNFFNDYILELLKVNVFTLVELSHQVSFWIANKDKIHGFRSTVSYELEDI